MKHLWSHYGDIMRNFPQKVFCVGNAPAAFGEIPLGDSYVITSPARVVLCYALTSSGPEWWSETTVMFFSPITRCSENAELFRVTWISEEIASLGLSCTQESSLFVWTFPDRVSETCEIVFDTDTGN